MSVSIWSDPQRRHDLDNALSKLDQDVWLFLTKDIWLLIMSRFNKRIQYNIFAKVCKTFRIWLNRKPIKINNPGKYILEKVIPFTKQININTISIKVVELDHKKSYNNNKKRSHHQNKIIVKENKDKETVANLSAIWQEEPDDSDESSDSDDYGYFDHHYDWDDDDFSFDYNEFNNNDFYYDDSYEYGY